MKNFKEFLKEIFDPKPTARIHKDKEVDRTGGKSVRYKNKNTGVVTGIDFNKILEKMDFINTNKPSSTIPPDLQPDTTIPPVKDTTEYIPKDTLLLKKKRTQNSTFKNKSHLNHRFSLKRNQ